MLRFIETYVTKKIHKNMLITNLEFKSKFDDNKIVCEYNNLIDFYSIRNIISKQYTVFLDNIQHNKFYKNVLYESLKYIGVGKNINILYNETDVKYINLNGIKHLVDYYFPDNFKLIKQTNSEICYTRYNNTKSYYMDDVTGITFGIFTSHDSKRLYIVYKLIEQLNNLKVKNTIPIEIIVSTDKKIDVDCDKFFISNKNDFITYKKNNVCDLATYSDIILLHDRYTLCDDFLNDFLNNAGYGICNIKQITTKNERGMDWPVCNGNNHTYSVGGLLNYRDYSDSVYVYGGAYAIKKDFWKKYKLNENINWNESEDVDYSRRIQYGGNLLRLNQAILLSHDDRWIEHNPYIKYSEYNYNLNGPCKNEFNINFLFPEKKHEYDNISLLIQGPCTSNALKQIDYAKKNIKINNIFYSAWVPEHGEGQHILNKIISELGDDNVRKTALPSVENIYNYLNIYYQAYSTLEGLYLIKTDYVIKVRSDEYYFNLKPMIDYIFNFKDKIVSINYFFRKDNFIKYHISDHLLGGKTSNLHVMFNHAKMLCQNYKSYENTYFNKMRENIAPEIILTMGYLQSKGIMYENFSHEEIMEKSLEYMNTYFKAIDIFKLKPFEFKYNDYNITFTENDDPKKIHYQFENCIGSDENI